MYFPLLNTRLRARAVIPHVNTHSNMNRWSRTITILFFALALLQGAEAQPSDISRLRHIMLEKEAKGSYTRDTSYIDILDSLAYGYYRISADSLFLYSKKALAYAREAGYARGESTSLRIMGNWYSLKSDYANMLSCYQQALTIAERIKSPVLTAKALTNMAITYYSEVGQIDEALALLEKAGNIFQSTGDSLDLIKTLQGRGALWVHQKQYGKALQIYRRAAELATAMKNDYLVVTTNDNIGGILFAKGLYKEALPYSLATLAHFNRTDDKMRISRTAYFVAKTYLHLRNYPEALKLAHQSLAVGTAIKSVPQIKEAVQVLANTYEAKGDTYNALKYLRLYNFYSDSLLNETVLKKTAILEARYEFEKKEARLKEEQEKKDALHQHVVRIKELQISIAALLIFFLIVLAFLLFRSRAINKKNNQILQKNNEKIEQQANQLLINNQEKDKLFSIIAHDLKVPLYSLRQILALLKRGALPEAKLHLIMQELSRDVDYSSELVSNLLSWAGSQMNGRVVTPVALSLQQVASDTISLFTRQAS
jgi:two-component system, sensor histidine kinase and response regulator